MKKYLLSNSTDKKEVGYYIQTVGTSEYSLSDEQKKKYRGNLSSEFFPEKDPVLEFELEPKAKLTDVVSASNISAKGFLMNEKAKTVFEQFNLIEHKFYNATLKTKNEILPYYWLHLVNDSFESIDFHKSKFFEADYIGRKKSDIIINSLEDFLIKREELMIRAEKIALKESAICQPLDLFFFFNLHSYVLISENFKDSIVSNKIKGLNYSEADFI